MSVDSRYFYNILRKYEWSIKSRALLPDSKKMLENPNEKRQIRDNLLASILGKQYMQVGLKYKKNWWTFSKKTRVGYSLGYSSATRVYKFRFIGITQMQYIIHKYPIGQQIKMLEKGRMLRKDTVAN